ncbi:uncharacterized protein DUF58 [Anseongella ginsenosidimutans]|uniref:Uncharacterized protein DUF58 n=1 Tax=Anseongella ginsenosidimutans TaxID=496056 RepID=A0A4R3KQW4_9SPHI|nr:DUF58 domain-containing protein [Anseongella ginsenosidimutans]TCS85904.1 uncharacterized protein DUF58 [Anseongella ginsenosidimutans]
MQSLNDINDLHKFQSLDLIARQVVEGFITGLHKSPFHGFSVEFAEHRLYNTGESVRNIDWKLYGRTDKLFSKRYEEETNLRCQLIIDCSASMYFPETANNKLAFSAYSAAALTQLLKRQRDAFGLSLFSDHISLHTASRSTASHQKLLYFELDKLLQAQPEKKGSAIAATIHEIAEKLHKRSLVVIFTDMMDSYKKEDELFAALQHLKHNKHEVVLFHVRDAKHEIEFSYENRPYIFVDVESGHEVKAFPHEVKQTYRLAMERFRKEMKLRCGAYGIDLVEADIDAGFYPVLYAYLVKRNRMKG